MNALLLSVFLLFSFQEQNKFIAPSGALNARELEKVQQAKDVEARIKIYESASKRMMADMDEAGAKEEFKAFPERLKSWTALISHSLGDIETNLKKKKKSRPLINFEIQVRHAITNLDNMKLKAPVEQQDTFESAITTAEAARKKFVEILFRH